MKATKTDRAIPLEKTTARANFRVSSMSLWIDRIWRLDNPSPGQRNHIGWHFRLPDGSWSTDPENHELLESFREVVWGMLTDGGWYGRTFRPGTVVGLGAGARPLFRWMSWRQLKSFTHLTPEIQQRYLDELPLQIVLGDDFYRSTAGVGGVSEIEDSESYEDYEDDGNGEDGDGDPDESEGPEDHESNENGASADVNSGMADEDSSFESDKADDKATYNVVSLRIKFLYAIYAQGENLKQRGFGYMSELPFDGRKLQEVVSKIAKQTYRKTPPLPDEVALPLLQAAISWVEVCGPDVVALQQAYLDALNGAFDRRLSDDSARKEARRELLKFTFSDDPATGAPWRGRIQLGEVLHYPHQNIESTAPGVMRHCIMRVRDAGVTLLQYLVGLRPSEICGIEGGTNEVTGLPSCVFTKYSDSGLLELFYLKSVLSKGVDQPRQDEWLLGCRPVGSPWLPLSVRCLILLERLFAPWRTLGGRSDLLVTFSIPHGIPGTAEGIGRITTPGLAKSFQIFIFSEVDLSGLPDESVRGESLVEYRRRNGLNITPRYGRKTFAAFMLESRASLLSAVKDHFKHMTVATTENAYFPQDARMREDVDSVLISDTIGFFVEAVKGKQLVGRMAPILEKYFGSDEFRNVEDAAELDRLVGHVVITHDLRIFFADHGKCLITADPLNSRCREAAGTANWNNLTPDFSVRTPGMCAGCRVFAADRSNLPFWERRLERYTNAYVLAKSNGREHEYRVHLARAEQAAQVIKMFNGTAAYEH